MWSLTNVFSENFEFKEVWRNYKATEIRISSFNKYFYCMIEDVDFVVEEAKKQNISIQVDRDKVYETIDNRKVKKVYCSFYYSKFTKFLKESITLYESDLNDYVKYAIEKKLKYGRDRRVFLLDIETDACNTPFFPEGKITAICIYDSMEKKYFLWALNEDGIKPEIAGNVDLKIYTDEIKLIQAFIDYTRNNKPDVIAGWYSNDFDIPYIVNRARYLNLDVDCISFGNKDSKIRCERYENKVSVSIPGIDCIDLIPVLQRITAYMRQPSNYNLSTVAQFFLGEEFHKTDFKIRDWKIKFKEFLEYNLRDVELLYELNEKMGILNYCLILQCDMVPIKLESVTANTRILELYLKMKHENIILPDKKKSVILAGEKVMLNEETRVKIKGAFTGKLKREGDNIEFVDPDAGVFKNVCVFDFSGMYPSIYSTFNISTDTIEEDAELKVPNIPATIEAKTEMGDFKPIKTITIHSSFNLDKRGLIPQIIDEVRVERTKYKKVLKSLDKEKDKLEYQKNKCIEDVLKLIGNAFYGAMSFNEFRLFSPNISGAITTIARDLLVFTTEKLRNLGYVVLYGDTDSIFVSKNGEKIDKESLLTIINALLKDKVVLDNKKLEKHFCIKLDSAYDFDTIVFNGAKKRYFGILNNKEFVTKGFEIVRRDTPKKVKPILQKLFISLLEKGRDEIRNDLKNIKVEIYGYDAQDLGINLTISRNLEDYKTNTLHIRAAKYSVKNFGMEFKSGDKMKLIFVKGTGKYPPTDVVAINEDFDLPVDFKIDYERFYEHLIMKKLNLLSEIKDFGIHAYQSKDESLLDYFK